MYDERGRPINPETKRINRDVIRSHNEVMMVIGVAEPENGTVDAEAEAARRHRQYEDRIGRRLLLAGGVLETAGIWGVNGMRQRILVSLQLCVHRILAFLTGPLAIQRILSGDIQWHVPARLEATVACLLFPGWLAVIPGKYDPRATRCPKI